MNSNHWNKVYSEKDESQVSWFQEVPTKSLDLIRELGLSSASSIIDIGGGESRLVDHLIQMGFLDISVLDISSVSIDKLKARIPEQNKKLVSFICSDVTTFRPVKKYKLWHDRATFHFLTSAEQVESYLKIAYEGLDEGGFLIVSTFSHTGPDKCSGLPICRYSIDELKEVFGRYFSNIKCIEDTHTTPWGSKQDFVFCGFRKI